MHVPPPACYCSSFLASRLISSASLAIAPSPTLTRSPRTSPLSPLARIDNGAIESQNRLLDSGSVDDATEGKKFGG